MLFLEESIKLEINASNIYLLFGKYLHQHKEFWEKLSFEELNHAALLKTAIQFNENDILPESFIDLNIIEQLKTTNKIFPELIEKFKNNPTISNAKSIAILIESSVGEIHYQKIMNEDSDNKIIKIFQKLNNDDKNHLERIMNLEEHNH